MRWFTPGLTVTGVFASIIAVLTGQVNLPRLDSFRGSEPPVYDDPISASVSSSTQTWHPTEYSSARAPNPSIPSQPGAVGTFPKTTDTPSGVSPVSLNLPGGSFSWKSPTTIRIATFNIQMFGEKKSSDPAIMAQLAAIFAQFDVVAVQEIRGDPEVPIGRLMQAIAKLGGRYQAIHGPPLGRSSQTECYGFVWDQTRVSLVPDSNYVVDDPVDRMHREPMIASFQTTFSPADARQPFRFTLMNVHTDPDEVSGITGENELNVLDDVFQSVRNFEYEICGEDDFIMLGDLNVDVGGLKQLGEIPGVVSLVGDVPTNTRKTKTYDHLLLDSRVTTEYVRRSGVMDLESFLGIDMEAATKVSDHLPVWAEFSVHESPRTY
ncbi:endonuclease/exonuclease/phosphatase family protein [Neorhodopirellula pilleata]|uniref:endonuclease/exonuclease/phosphatase family protein n=1 Tax=Neorhodopirellula pilleata TaxID=2714738 RepID=UPI001E31E88E|nr:endonuclease/exonuclease/phosphatase family protein [Neorhodopirellula pilleata]